jgi:hypothetical protein
MEMAGWLTRSPTVNAVFRLMFIRHIISPETFPRHGVFPPWFVNANSSLRREQASVFVKDYWIEQKATK